MIRIQVKIPISQEMILPLKMAKKKLEARLVVLGREAHNFMTNFVEATKKRPGGGTLAKSISFETIRGLFRGGFAIGKIAQLPLYWYVINYGKKFTGEPFVPGDGKYVPLGQFVPGQAEPNSANFREGRWQVGGQYTFRAKQTIEPMNYIENTIVFFRRRLERLLRKV